MVPAPRRNSFTQEDRERDRYEDAHEDQDRGGNFQVVIRVRPALERERLAPGFQDITQVSNDGRQLTIQEVVGEPVSGSLQQLCTNHVFTFDHVYGPNSTQSEVYVQTAKPAVLSSLEGYNATILAYGQTGTGKTHTMGGCSSHHPLVSHEARGIVPRCMDEIFKCIEECTNPNARFLVRASYLQIYNEQLSDLLKHGVNLTIREDGDRGVYVEGLSEWVVRSPAEVATLMERGGSIRATAHTTLNDVSSRSHSVFIIIVERAEANDSGAKQSVRVGKLNLVDLAGSERVRLTGAKGARLEESKKINQSLSALGNVIAALTDNRGRAHIPYRDSKLTRLLEDSLGGNCKTTMMAMVSPALEAFGESLSTLRFAHRAKSIHNNAHVNEDVDASTMLRRYETELRRLRAELRTLKKDVVDKRQLDVVEEKVRRAEEDKAMALNALEER
jgi:kinesin family protein 3/17